MKPGAWIYLWICLMSLCSAGGVLAAQRADTALSGRLFYTPEERVMLVNARAHKVTEIQKSYVPPDSAPVVFDGILTRSDGVATHWINGRPQVGQPSAQFRKLRPGQTRAYSKAYEPYQLLRPSESIKTPNTSAKPALDNEATP